MSYYLKTILFSALASASIASAAGSKKQLELPFAMRCENEFGKKFVIKVNFDWEEAAGAKSKGEAKVVAANAGGTQKVNALGELRRDKSTNMTHELYGMKWAPKGTPFSYTFETRAVLWESKGVSEAEGRLLIQSSARGAKDEMVKLQCTVLR